MRATIATVVSVVLCAGSMASGAWMPGDPHVMHFPQLPDVSDAGMDVLITPTAVADDFVCTSSGPVTGITLWGSWLDDSIGELDLNVAVFSNIPAGSAGVPYDRPGNLLWSQFVPSEDLEVMGVAELAEPFYDADTNQVLGTSNVLLQYDISIDAASAFEQQTGIRYWLVLQKADVVADQLFGWKTSFDKYEASAVYLSGGGELLELQYPISHQFAGQGMDMAFVITPEPGTLSLLVLAGAALLRRRRR